MPSSRLDLLLVTRGMAGSRAQAQAMIMAGRVQVNGETVRRPAALISAEARVELIEKPPFVSRGGEKLEAALTAFSIQVSGRVCADLGASTGGFTDCLLQHGAARVYAIDVGKGLLDWKLRQDRRVVVMEETNARYLERLPETVSLVTIDVSFISLKMILPVVKKWFSPVEKGEIIALIKPQFEAGRKVAARGKGVIRDPKIHRQVLQEVLSFAQTQGFGILGLLPSPLIGPKGNREFLVWLRWEEKGKEISALLESLHLKDDQQG